MTPQKALQATSTTQVEIVSHATTTDALAAYTRAIQHMYGLDDSFYDTIQCESRFKATAWNKEDPNGGSKGVAQFQQSTFDKWSVEAGIKDGDIWDSYQAIDTAAYMFSKGQQRQWSCYHIVTGA